MKNNKFWKLKKSRKNFHITFLLSDCMFGIVLVKISIFSWKNMVVSQIFMVLYTILISSSLIYIHANSFLYITFSEVLGLWMPDSHLEDPGLIPPSSQDLFYFFLLFLGLSQNFTKNQSWILRYDHFFRMNIKILTIRILKK